MSSMRGLVDGECGDSGNALTRITRHVVQHDAGTSAAGRTGQTAGSSRSMADQFTREYTSAVAVSAGAANTFNMRALMSTMNAQAPRQHRPHETAARWSGEYGVAHAAQPVTRTAAEWQTQYAAQTPMDAQWTVATRPSSDVAVMFVCRSIDDHMSSVCRPQSTATQWGTEFLSNYDVDARVQTPVEAKATEWTNESTNEDYWHNLEHEWDNMAQHDPESNQWLTDWQRQQDQLYSDYELQSDNPYMHTTSDALAEGKRLLAAGDLANAILHLEAAVQHDGGSGEAWRYLGMAQSENEQEPMAIAALKKAVAADAADIHAHFSLAVAYTNEYMSNEAIMSLTNWLRAHPAYGALIGGDLPDPAQPRPFQSSFMDTEQFAKLEQCFLRAAASQPARVDADLQNALGVLYNLRGNFDRATDSFRTALQVKPDDARAWNRLGATLANSGREHSAEAISAYGHALSLYPGYVRARYNIGVSCLHLNSRSEALEHFVSALQLQCRGLGPSTSAAATPPISDSIWQTMRMTAMGLDNEPGARLASRKDELMQAIDAKNLTRLTQMIPTGGSGGGGMADMPTSAAPPSIPSGTASA